MIDIVLCCYNQEKYIEQTVKSIYSQKFSDKANLIVADDCSQDKTLEIIKSIPNPDWINLVILPNTHNLGFIKNYKRAFEQCTSDFIFILEGDDFWHFPNHLQQHVDFLTSHPEISMSMNRLTLEFVASDKTSFSPWKNSWKEYKTWSLKEQIFANRLGNLSACCFRGELIKKLPENLFDIDFADWLLGMIMAETNPIAVLQESTSTYRIQPMGQWSGMTYEEQRQDIIASANLYNEYFENKYDKYFTELIKRTNSFYSRLKIFIKKLIRWGK